METASSPTTSVLWFYEEKGRVHNTLTAVYRRVREESRWKREADEYHATLYCGSAGSSGITQQSRSDYIYGPATLPYNLCRMASDTLVSKVAKHRPMPQVMANRGNWKDQKRAKKCTQFLEGAFYKHRIFESHSKQIIRDASIFKRGGWLKVTRVGKRAVVERCHGWEIDVDDWDGRYDDPRNLYHCRTMDKGVLLESFARTEAGGYVQKKKEAIESGGTFDVNQERMFYRSTTVDRVDVLEAWHLCDDIEAHEQEEDHKCSGRHVITVPNGTLIDEEWPHPFFPFARLRYSDPLVGSDGHSLVEQLEGYQYEQNLTSAKISEGHHLLGSSWVLVPDGAGMHEQQFRNGIHLLYYKPIGKPEVFQPQPVHPAIYQRQRDLTEHALADAGISAMSAQSQTPAGITAAVAIQAVDDIETERFIVFGRAYETWCLDVARLLLAVIKEIAEIYGDYAVPVHMKQGILKLEWKDVQLDGYELRVFPTSMLPQQLSARLEKLKMLFESQLIDRATFLRQLDAPDLSAEMDLETADKVLIDEQLESMLDADESEEQAAFKTPSPYVDLKWAAKRAHQKVNRAELDGAPEYNKDLLRQWIEWCDAQIAKIGLSNDNGAPPDAGVPGAPPPGPPGMPPMPPGPPMPGGGPPMPPDMGMPPVPVAA